MVFVIALIRIPTNWGSPLKSRWWSGDVVYQTSSNIIFYRTNALIFISALIHWGRVTHIWASKLSIIGSGNGLAPTRRQAIIWTNHGILLIRPLGTNFSEKINEVHIFSFKKMHLKMSSAKCQPFCLDLNVLMKVICTSKNYACKHEMHFDSHFMIASISEYVHCNTPVTSGLRYHIYHNESSVMSIWIVNALYSSVVAWLFSAATVGQTMFGNVRK